jgi:hypothetical protein
MDDGKTLYEREAKNWPSPLGWDNLSKASKHLWEEHAERIEFRRRDLDAQQGQSVRQQE